MNSTTLLRGAIRTARSGKREVARALFKNIVQLDPENEVAWMWLSGLYDSLDDKIYTSEKVLSTNPSNRKTRIYLDKLYLEKKSINTDNSILNDNFQKVRNYAEAGRNGDALGLLNNILEIEKNHKSAWILFADLSPKISDKVNGYEAALNLDPSDAKEKS
ncbi:MAG: hypothetical protein QGD88_07565 [Anaerolineae bacterium]|nr:hypothetical protein [Anaerolineae bacterium]